MLRADEIEALRDAADWLTQPIVEYLLQDLAKRIAEAGRFTATAQYEIWHLQQLGISQRETKKRLKQLLKVSNQELQRLMTQSAEVGYNYDIKSLPYVSALPFRKNEVMQQIVSAAVKLAQENLTNITQTLGMVDPYGKAMPLQKAYRSCMDYAFMQVSTGATDYNTAVRQAVKNLAEKGVRYIDYESGAHTTLEAAVRRSVMGGLGLMQEQISQRTHDDMGANGWEIDAHHNSAPDHEPIQGKQYSDAEYTTLNNSLVRRIGTLNCGHSAHPIILGVSIPQYTPEELERMRRQNEEGITYNGKHYTGYEATQRQRALERAMRRQKRRILTDEATGDAEKLQTDQIKLRILHNEYEHFSDAANLRTQYERAENFGFGHKQAGEADKEYRAIAKKANSMYDTGSEVDNVKAYMRDLPIRKEIRAHPEWLVINAEKQARHQKGKDGYIPGRSYVTVDDAELQSIVDRHAATGEIQRSVKGMFMNKEIVTVDHLIGVSINPKTLEETPTNRAYIHYSKTGAHIVPTAKEMNK